MIKKLSNPYNEDLLTLEYSRFVIAVRNAYMRSHSERLPYYAGLVFQEFLHLEYGIPVNLVYAFEKDSIGIHPENAINTICLFLVTLT